MNTPANFRAWDVKDAAICDKVGGCFGFINRRCAKRFRCGDGGAGRRWLAKMTLENTQPLDNGAVWLRYRLRTNRHLEGEAELVLPDRIELSTSPLPRECSTTELRQHALDIAENRSRRHRRGTAGTCHKASACASTHGARRGDKSAGKSTVGGL